MTPLVIILQRLINNQDNFEQHLSIIVYAAGYFEIFETLSFVQMVLQLSPPVQEHLRTWLAEHLNQIQKRE